MTIQEISIADVCVTTFYYSITNREQGGGAYGRNNCIPSNGIILFIDHKCSLVVYHPNDER